MPAPSPGYSRTDVIAAAFVLVGFGLDVLAGFWPQLNLDPATRNTLIGSLTVLVLAGTAAYVKNRDIKYQAATKVAVAQVTAPPVVIPPAAGASVPAGPFLLTPVPAETSTTGSEHPTP